MASIIYVHADWATAEEWLIATAALRAYCRSPHSDDWLDGLEDRYPSLRRAWQKAERSLANLIEHEDHPFALDVRSPWSTHGEPPGYVPTVTIGNIDGFRTGWSDPILLEATADLVALVRALGAVEAGWLNQD